MIASLQLATPLITLYEWLDLGAKALVPFVLAFVGYFVGRAAKRIDHAQWTNQKVIERRLDLFQEMAPLANMIYCYFAWRGRWKEYSPIEITQARRTLADCIYVNSYMFSDDLVERYLVFEDMCFATFSGPNRDAKLKTAISRAGGDDRHKAFQGQGKGDWQEEWDKMFVKKRQTWDEMTGKKNDAISSGAAVKQAYEGLVAAFRRDLRQIRDTDSDGELSRLAWLRIRPWRFMARDRNLFGRRVQSPGEGGTVGEAG